TVPSDLTPGDGYVIRVYDAGGGSEFDESDNDFSIISAGSTAEITSPNGGEILRTGLTYTISWNGGFSNTGIELYKGETKVLDINGDVGSSNSFEWSIPEGLSIGDNYKIRVYDAGSGENFDESDSYFSIFEQSNFSGSNSNSLSLSDNSYISLQEIDSNLGKANSSITISSWFKSDKNPNRDVIIHASTSNEQYGRMGFTDSGANGKIYLGSDDVSGSTDFTDNRLWNHMVYVADAQNNELKIYVNGVLENTKSINLGADYYDANRTWQIGHLSEEGSQHDYTGLLDEVAVWNTALTINDIVSLYNNGNPTLAYNIKLSNLRAYYDFEDNSLNDKTGRAIHPTFSINSGFSNIVPPNSSGIVSFPAGGEKLICGRAYPIRWENGFANNGIQLYNGSEKISEISGDAGSGNKFSWTIDCATAGEGYSIRIYDAGPGEEYFQGGTFEIDTDPKNKYNALETISYSYNSSTPVTTSTTFQSSKNYYMEASGTVYYSNQNLMDAAYRLRGLNQDIDPPVPYDDNQNWPHDSGTSWTWNGQ
ncbi:MAG: LamG-like jellyroll fold domain-containing protein, partial [Candidatus Neomarinimicrobiota bacterium]